MENMTTWRGRPEDHATLETLPYRPAGNRGHDPLLGIESFGPAFWKLMADPTGVVPLATTSPGPPPGPNAPMEEISIVSKRPAMQLSDDQITNILVGEAVSLSGPGVDEMRRQMAQTIMNADEAFGERRVDWARTAPDILKRKLSPAEERIRESIRENVLQARERFKRAEDPTNLATQFMKRPDTSAPPSKDRPKNYGKDFRLEDIQGPFRDSQANGEPSKYVYFWQNPMADKYYGRRPR